MKKLTLPMLLLLITVGLVSAQNREEKKFDSFTSISFRAAGKVYVRQGTPQKVEFEGDRDYIKDLDPRVEGNKLVIGREGWNSWTWGDSDNRRITVYVTMATIEGLAVAGSGDLVGESKFTARDLYLKVSGSGTLTVEADASGEIEADVSGSGRIDLKGKGRMLDSHVSGSGRVWMDVAVADRIGFGVSGSGRIEAKGTAEQVKVSISGSGEVRGADLVVDRCDIRVSGSGGVEINVNKELDANISGSGTVRYKGNPAHVNSHSSGSGKVRKL